MHLNTCITPVLLYLKFAERAYYFLFLHSRERERERERECHRTHLNGSGFVSFNGTAEEYTQPLQTQTETGVQAGDARPKGCEISITQTITCINLSLWCALHYVSAQSPLLPLMRLVVRIRIVLLHWNPSWFDYTEHFTG